LLEGLTDKGRIAHVIADAAYDADHLRGFVSEGLGAKAQIKPNPSRADKPDTDRALYKGRNLVERFFDNLKHHRRIALRCAARRPPPASPHSSTSHAPCSGSNEDDA
jgi:transposase